MACVAWSCVMWTLCPACPGPVMCGVLLASKSWACAVCCPVGLCVLVLCFVVLYRPPCPVTCALCCPAGLCVLVLCRVVPCWPPFPCPVLCVALLALLSGLVPWGALLPACHVPVPCGQLLATLSLYLCSVVYCCLSCPWSCVKFCPAELRVMVLCCFVPCWRNVLGTVLCGTLLACVSWSCAVRCPAICVSWSLAVWSPAGIHVPGSVLCGALLACVS